MNKPIWMLDPTIAHIPQEKLEFLSEMFEKVKDKNKAELMPFLMAMHSKVKGNVKFTAEEMQKEYLGWKDYIRTHIPDPYEGIREILHRQKAEGGMICVVSHSGEENITRDYETHFGLKPDMIYGWDLPEHQRKPSTYPLLDIMARYGFRPEELLVVDDLKLAHTMARNAGVKIGFAAWSKEDLPMLAEEMQRICDFTFPTPQALYDFLFG